LQREKQKPELTGIDRMNRMKGFAFNLKGILFFVLYILFIPVK
jgi:hypothetical protein